MRCRCFFLPTVLLVLLGFTAGCSYIHFGRLDRIRNDTALAAENSDLRIEKKLLKEELEIARKEREALTSAIEHAAGGSGSDELAARLTATSQQLVALRESYAQLKADREQLKPTPLVRRIFQPADAPPRQQIAGLSAQLNKTEEKLADAMRAQSELQGENTRLRAELEKVHAENASLAAKVEQMTAENSEARAALAQLNTVLLAQKAARAEAEQSAEALRAGLKTPVAAPNPEPALSLSSARESSADAARELAATLQSGTLSPATTAVASLATSPAKLAPAAGSAAAPTPATPPPGKTPKTYVVREGDSLEKIAEHLYGRRDRWIMLYAANNALLSDGRPLTPGMPLQVPDA